MRGNIRRNQFQSLVISLGILIGLVGLIGCGSDEVSDTDLVMDSFVVGDLSSSDNLAESLDCRIDGEVLDCSVALLLTHLEIDGTTARDKCRFICDNGLEHGERGLIGSWCDVACEACISIVGLDCESCDLLSEETIDPQCP